MKLKDLEPYHRKLAVLRVQEKTSIEGFYMIGPADSNFPHTAYVAGLDDALLYSRAPEMLEKLKKAEDALQGLFLPMKGPSAFLDAQSKCKETLKEITDLLNS